MYVLDAWRGLQQHFCAMADEDDDAAPGMSLDQALAALAPAPAAQHITTLALQRAQISDSQVGAAVASGSTPHAIADAPFAPATLKNNIAMVDLACAIKLTWLRRAAHPDGLRSLRLAIRAVLRSLSLCVCHLMSAVGSAAAGHGRR